MEFKEGVKVDGISKEIINAMAITEAVLMDNFGYELTVTSVTDGTHKEGSKHYEGKAFDIRTWEFHEPGIQLPKEEKEMIAGYLQDALGDDFDVVVERTHIHIEYDPEEI